VFIPAAEGMHLNEKGHPAPNLKNVPSGFLIAKRGKSSRRSSSPVTLSNIRYHAHKSYTRVVLDLPRKRSITKARDTSNQVILKVNNTQLGKTARKRLTQKNFPRGIQISEQSHRSLSIQLDRNILQAYKLQTLQRPDRIVLDLFYTKSNRHTGREAASTQTRDNPPVPKPNRPLSEIAMATPPSTEKLPTASPGNPEKTTPPSSGDTGSPTVIAPPAQNKSFRDVLVVIDPGHGGKDPGAIGKKGTREKEVTLRIATKLQGLIEHRLGTKVLLTRTNDRFLELEDRVAFANSQKADVFLSIHVNSHPQRSIKGLEVYHFGKASDPRALEVAARENGMTLEENAPPWQFIIADKLNDQKIQESQTFAWTTRETLLNTLTKQYAVKDHGVKTAPFYVLRFTTMPSILAEVAFVSNPSEEKRLRSRQYQNYVAEGMYKGIQAYLKTLYPGIS